MDFDLQFFKYKLKVLILTCLLAGSQSAMTNPPMLSSIIPESFINLLGKRTSNGNCLGTVKMVFMEQNTSQKHTELFLTPKEFHGWKRKELACQIVGENEIREGDIITFYYLHSDSYEKLYKMLEDDRRTPGYNAQHSAIYIGEGKVFEKPGYHKRYGPYRINTLRKNKRQWLNKGLKGRGGVTAIANSKAECVDILKEDSSIFLCGFMRIERCELR